MVLPKVFTKAMLRLSHLINRAIRVLIAMMQFERLAVVTVRRIPPPLRELRDAVERHFNPPGVRQIFGVPLHGRPLFFAYLGSGALTVKNHSPPLSEREVAARVAVLDRVSEVPHVLLLRRRVVDVAFERIRRRPSSEVGIERPDAVDLDAVCDREAIGASILRRYVGRFEAR